MALLWCDGFDHYGGDITKLESGTWAEAYSSGGYFVLSSSISRTGTYSLARGAGSFNYVARRVLGGTKDTVGLGCALYCNVLPDINDRAVIMDFRDFGNQVTISVVLQSDGSLTVYRGDNLAGTQLGQTAVPVIVAESFQHIETQVYSNATSGSVEVRVNGVTVISVTGVNTISLAAEMTVPFVTFSDSQQGIAQVGFPGRTANGNYESTDINNGYFPYWDDIFAYDTTGTFNNDWLGDRRVYTLFPNADTATAEWTPLSGSGFSNITDPSDDDTSYLSAGIPGSPDSFRSDFDLEPLPETTGLVSAVMLSSRVKKLEAGVADYQHGIISNSAESEGVIHPINPTYIHHDDVFEYDPDTGAAFTPDAINALQIKVNRTS